MASNRKVTVVIPTYGRAHLLMDTIPTYLQPDVELLILIDDHSPDDTYAVVKKLMAIYSNIQYYRNEKNLKQTISKNRGKAMVQTEYVYFGDDDSILSQGGIQLLLQTAQSTQSDIVGASAVYLKFEKEVISETLANRIFATSVDEIVNLPKLAFNFSLQTSEVWEVPVCHAAFLARTELVKNINFDDGFIGNCYREETDFLLRCRSKNAKIVLQSNVTQTNLPPTLATGGARSRGRLLYEYFALYNTIRFVFKNKSILKMVDGRCRPIPMILQYVYARFRAVARRTLESVKKIS